VVRKHRACPARRVYTDLIEKEHGLPMPELERVATERNFEEVQGAGSNLWVLGTIGSAAPFIGLFGTVLGIIRAFHAIALAGTGGFAVVASGISEALIATALGLAVGIIAVVCFNYFQSRVERIDAALRIGSARVLEALNAGRRAHGA
jgi:biopolymer transport protein ExbB/TolQ